MPTGPKGEKRPADAPQRPFVADRLTDDWIDQARRQVQASGGRISNGILRRLPQRRRRAKFSVPMSISREEIAHRARGEAMTDGVDRHGYKIHVNWERCADAANRREQENRHSNLFEFDQSSGKILGVQEKDR